MASLICKYCGSYINDTDEVCPNCSAVNEHYKRTSDGTPRTIEELKQWYVDRKLPPEETTRFFIGKNIREPRAFGIYEENGRFIVYKNKGDGSRAIRYEGRDEAYAVNELYLRLKEEILNQKKRNSKNIGNSSRKTTNYNPDTRVARNNGPVARNYNSKNYTPARYSKPAPRKRSALASLLVGFGVMGFVCVMMMAMFAAVGADLVGLVDSSHYHYYYMGSDNTPYFLDAYDSDAKEMSWWRFDEASQNWEYYQAYPADSSLKIVGPSVVDVEAGYNSLWDFASQYNKDSSIIDITTNHDFIDAGHHYSPSMSYYSYDDKLYYYLDDSYSSYGSTDNTGWYVYENDAWQYYCSPDDHVTLGDDLWYNDEQYAIGDDYIDIYSYTDEYSYAWNATDFEDTQWYSNYEANENAYQDYINSIDDDSDYDSGYDSDYDYDWDYDSDWDSGWDSGGSDWDSDW